MGRGRAWFDTGTHGSLPEAGKFVRRRQFCPRTPDGSPNEIALSSGQRAMADLEQAGKGMARNDGGRQRLALVPKAPSPQP